ncbi:MAG: DUF4097 family beta strand repeat-containing protein [Pyrinomonadaceae bacterium]
MKSLIFQSKHALTLFALSALIMSPTIASAQKRFSKTYSASRNIRLQLTNRSGTITVSGWERNEVRVTAQMEAPAAKIVPDSTSEALVINVVRDNYGRGDVGSVNFDIKVPVGSTVDIETKMGNLTVRDVSGEMVRANVTSEGDITLSGVKSSSLMANNVTGDIFFDGEFQSGGNYRFSTTRGNINLRIPFNSSFRMIATAPSTRNIDLGAFSNNGLNFISSDGRRVVGNVNGGESSLTLTSQRGSISFIKR